MKDLHKIRNFFLEKLYEHFLIILRDGKDTRNEGLSWVIREIFALDKIDEDDDKMIIGLVGFGYQSIYNL